MIEYLFLRILLINFSFAKNYNIFIFPSCSILLLNLKKTSSFYEIMKMF